MESRKPNLPPLYHYCMFLISKSQIALDEIIYTAALIKRYCHKIGRTCPLNYYKLVAVCIYLSQKVYREEKFWGAKDFSYIAGIKLETLKALELEFLQEIDFDVLLKDEQYSKMDILLSTFCKTKEQCLTLAIIYRGYH